MNDQLNPAAQTLLDAVAEEELAEAADLCGQFDVPAEYARHVAAMIAVCTGATL